jgi:hypothetical protein
MIANENGDVAIKYYQTMKQMLNIGGNKYIFEIRANICMCWIAAQDVNKVLAITKTCCGGNQHSVFRYANDTDVRRWTNRGGP